ncbi:MAG TPA: CbiX/SirB N-terminal domain-containing protein, partial [Gemmatimonadaceae bacterium]|nr:CbiX/SirB N-terminal domain-containing protein [Gemmatimonadaceae bacterium]
MRKAILIIDHGSRRGEANEMLDCVANLVQAMAGREVIVRHAHMELAEPSIEAGFAACVEAGATEIIAFPYMLSPGKHSTADIPRMVSEAALAHPAVRWSVTPALGVHEKLAEVILERAGVPGRPIGADRCWHSSGAAGTCGDACRCNGDAGAVRTSDAGGRRAFGAAARPRYGMRECEKPR